MPYSFGNGIWNGVFAVPNAVVDEHLKMASGLSVKVLLLLLRQGGGLDADEIAVRLGYAAEDIRDALNYWEREGVIAAGGAKPRSLTPTVQYREIPEVAPLSAPAVPAVLAEELPPGVPDPEAPRRVAIISAGRRRLTTQEINEMADRDENIEHLLQETQSVLGKPLTPVSTDVVVALYTYYAMQPDMILMLIHYCASIGKESLRYIEKVAADWLDKGIDTHEKAEAEIFRLTRRDSAEGKIKSAFGIYDRSLVSSEKKYIQIWTEDYKQDIPLISLAYERAVEIKGKLSFPYINGILTNWHNKGITAPAQAMKEIRENRPKPPAKSDGSSYDIGELENMIAHGNIV